MVPDTDLSLFVNAQARAAFWSVGANPDNVLVREFQRFYQHYDPMVRRAIARRRIRRIEADEVAQNIWLKAARRLPDFRGVPKQSSLEAWFKKLAKTAVQDALRARWRQRRFGDMLPADVEMAPLSPDPDEERCFQEDWDDATLEVLLDQLRERVSVTSFAVIWLEYHDGLPRGLIADRLGLSLKQVRDRRNRMILKLRGLWAFYTGLPFPNQRASRRKP